MSEDEKKIEISKPAYVGLSIEKLLYTLLRFAAHTQMIFRHFQIYSRDVQNAGDNTIWAVVFLITYLVLHVQPARL